MHVSFHHIFFWSKFVVAREKMLMLFLFLYIFSAFLLERNDFFRWENRLLFFFLLFSLFNLVSLHSNKSFSESRPTTLASIFSTISHFYFIFTFKAIIFYHFTRNTFATLYKIHRVLNKHRGIHCCCCWCCCFRNYLAIWIWIALEKWLENKQQMYIYFISMVLLNVIKCE